MSGGRPRRGLNPVRRRDEIDRDGTARLHTGVLEIFRAIRSSSELFLADRCSRQPGRLQSPVPQSSLLITVVTAAFLGAPLSCSIYLHFLNRSQPPPAATAAPRRPFRWPRWRPLTKTYYPGRRCRLKGIGCGFLRDWTSSLKRADSLRVQIAGNPAVLGGRD